MGVFITVGPFALWEGTEGLLCLLSFVLTVSGVNQKQGKIP